ncbi:MAG TPA: DUF2062 domain-containing protein [Bryobacteraceae bacterium]|nr:DUF2062 domain-containing protein [Bryobacteraceae bacterium]
MIWPGIWSTIRRRVVQPFIDLLKQGITPERIALTIALGITLGVTPVIGSTSLLCALAAITLRLNLPAIQLVNGLTYPLQLTMLVPFLRLGAWMFRVAPPAVSVPYLFSMIRANVWHAIATLWTATLHALVAWLTFACIGTGLLYAVLVPLLRMLWRREQTAPEAAAEC